MPRADSIKPRPSPLQNQVGTRSRGTENSKGPTRARMPDMTTETPQPEDFASLYRRAFTEYGTRALWNKRELEAPTPADALVVARALRVEGNRESRRLAEQIERACRAAI